MGDDVVEVSCAFSLLPPPNDGTWLGPRNPHSSHRHCIASITCTYLLTSRVQRAADALITQWKTKNKGAVCNNLNVSMI